MKIIYIVSSFQKSGPGNVVINLSNQLTFQGHMVTVISLSDDFDRYSELNDCVKTFSLHSKHNKVSNELIKEVQNIVKEFNPDIIHSHGIRSDFVLTRLKGEFTKISTSHNNPFIDYFYYYGLKGIFLAVFQIIIFRKLDYIVALTPNQFKLLNDLLINSNVKLIPNGVEKIKKNNLKIVEKNLLTIGIVANLIPRKNVEFVLDTFSKCNVNRLQIFVYGDGEQYDFLVNKFKDNIKIKFKGFETDKSKMFDSIDILFSMSLSEGLPLIVLEAISANVPIVLSDIPSHVFICDQLPNGSFILIRKKSERDLKRCLINIDKGKINFLSYKNIYNEKFSALKMSNSYLNIYRNKKL